MDPYLGARRITQNVDEKFGSGIFYVPIYFSGADPGFWKGGGRPRNGRPRAKPEPCWGGGGAEACPPRT